MAVVTAATKALHNAQSETQAQIDAANLKIAIVQQEIADKNFKVSNLQNLVSSLQAELVAINNALTTLGG